MFRGIWLYLFLNLEVLGLRISSEWSLLLTVYDTITIQSTKKGVNPLELTPCFILVELRGIEPLTA